MIESERLDGLSRVAFGRLVFFGAWCPAVRCSTWLFGGLAGFVDGCPVDKVKCLAGDLRTGTSIAGK